MLVPILLPKQLWSVEAQTPLDPWRCVVVSDTKMLAPDPLSPVGLPGGAFMGRTCLSSTSCRWLIDWLDWDLGNFGARWTLQIGSCAPQTVVEQFLLCGRARYAPGKRPQGILFLMYPLLGVRPDWSAAMQPHLQQNVMQHVIWHRSIWTSINFWPLELQ